MSGAVHEESSAELISKAEEIYELSKKLNDERTLREKVEVDLVQSQKLIKELKSALASATVVASTSNNSPSEAEDEESCRKADSDHPSNVDVDVRLDASQLLSTSKEERLLAVAEKKIKHLEQQLKQKDKLLRGMQEEKKRQVSLVARGEDEASLRARDLKMSNINLFERLAAAKNATKIAEAIIEKRDKQICLLTEHVEKLMGTLRNESEFKKAAEKRQSELNSELRSAQNTSAALVTRNRRLSKHARSVDKQDKMMEKQLQVIDAKYQALYRTHQLSKASAAKVEASFEKKMEEVSGWVWTSKQQLADLTTARNNTLLGVFKLYESVFGKMNAAVIDLQEIGLDDDGARALARTIEATVGRMNQRDEAKQAGHAKRVDSWQAGDKSGPLPFWGKADHRPRRSCVLNLSYNSITDKGLRPLMVALAKCRHITEVDLRGNRISRKSLPYIVHALVYNLTLEAIDMSGNKFTKVDLAEYLARYTSSISPHPHDEGSRSGSTTQHHISTNHSKKGGSSSDVASQSSETSSLSSSDEDDEDDFILNDDEEDESIAQELRSYPVLSTTDKATHSLFRFHNRRRPRSAPARSQLTSSDTKPDSWLPKHHGHSENPPSPFEMLKRVDVMKNVSKARLYPPKQSPFSAASRISLDSISSKLVRGTRRVRPRPETAMVSRFGGQELPMMTSPTQTNNLTSSGKLKFTSGYVKKRLTKTNLTQESSLRIRPQTATARLRTQMTLSPVRTPKPRHARTPTAAELRQRTQTSKYDQGTDYAPEDMQVAFKYARRGDIGGILNLMKQLDNSISFHANMRQLQTGETAIMHAARTGQADMIRLLLEKGGDINAVSNEGWTALHHAVDAKQSNMIQFLLQYRANPNLGAHTTAGTPLHLAVRLNRLECVCILLDATGIDIAAQDGRGRTAQHLAAQRKHNQVHRLLTEALAAKEAMSQNVSH